MNGWVVRAGSRIVHEVRPGAIMLGALLFLRIPLMVGSRWLFRPVPGWVGAAWVDGTHLLTAMLIWIERDRLREHNIGPGSIAVLVGWPVLLKALSLAPLLPSVAGLGLEVPTVPTGHLVIAATLGASLLLARVRVRANGAGALAWGCAGALAAAALGAGSGVLMRFQGPTRGVALYGWTWMPILGGDFLAQLTAAATLEEPVFRGFLWGYMKRMGYREGRILLAQAALFWMGHLYYFPRLPVSFWIVVPAGGLLFGLVAWRSRSVAAGMVAHALFNATAGLFAHYRL